ncbi:MAG: YicC family protein [Nitrospirae bacterium]|nr:YicC family protein [Nitrospirota bacterium]
MALVSMTGYGRSAGDGGLAVEVRSVNHRHLDIHCRLPKGWAALEAAVKAEVARHLRRGRVELGAFFGQGGDQDGYAVDRDQADRYISAIAHLAPGGGVERVLDAAQLLALPGVVVPASATLDPAVGEAQLLAAVADACRAALAMRTGEGIALGRELSQRLDGVEAAVARLEARRPGAVAETHQRLRARVAELAADVQIDPARLAQEVALLADRSDVTEELARLNSHMAQFRANLDALEPVGRTLDFLVVEMNREANTVGSKCQDAIMVNDVLFIKGELEKVREQVQNVE